MRERDVHFLRMAARLALRGHGGVEPNPMVGAVIVGPHHHVVGWGYHRRVGGPHAEIVALRRAHQQARGATLYVTLEPCNHAGRTPPCVDALMESGLKKVVIARRDPNPLAAGGLERLRQTKIEVVLNERCPQAIAVSDPFAHRVTTGLPWVVAKWAQTLDGRIATGPPHGESKWISNDASRLLVHRERGRVDIILTGLGTVLKDDPLLTARNVRVRRIARRVVIDPNLQMPLHAKLVTTTATAPTTLVCAESAFEGQPQRVKQLADMGVELVPFPAEGEEIALAPVLRELARRYDATNVLVEAGSGLLSRLFQQKLVNQAWAFIGRMLLGDDRAQPVVSGMSAARLTDGNALNLLALQRRASDVIAHYRVNS